MKLELVEKTVNGNSEKIINGQMVRSINGHAVDLYIDSETGVQYFVMYHGNAGAICPRYNADGSLYVTVSI